jgi:hypothetical protein
MEGQVFMDSQTFIRDPAVPLADDAGESQRIMCPAGTVLRDSKCVNLNDPAMGTMQESQFNGEMSTTRSRISEGSEQLPFVCPAGMKDTRDGYCQPPMIPFLKSSGAMSGGDPSSSSILASAPRVPYIGPCPPNTTAVADEGCLPDKIISYAPGAILIPYLSDLTTTIYALTSPITSAINNAAKKTTTSIDKTSTSIDNMAKRKGLENALKEGIATLSTSIDTINTSIQANNPSASANNTSASENSVPENNYPSEGGRRTRKKPRRRNRRTKNIAK